MYLPANALAAISFSEGEDEECDFNRYELYYLLIAREKNR